MSRAFRAVGDGIQATFLRPEVDLLRTLRDQLAATLQEADPDDPVMRRLFPPPILGDDRAAGDVARLFASELLTARLDGIEDLLVILRRGLPHGDGGLRVTLVDDEPLLFLGVLNDLRLAIGARIDIEALDRDAVSDDDPYAYPLHVMDYLAWWQEQLLAIIDPAEASDG